MLLTSYVDSFNSFFGEDETKKLLDEALGLIRKSPRIFFLGNGGSNSISSHMMQDYAKIGGKQTFCFSDPSLITCFANDFGYEFAMKEWLRIHFTKNDLLIATSSSGESANVLNAAKHALALGGNLITLTGFKKNNSLSKLGKPGFHINSGSYGIVECYHQVILHILLDSLNENH